MQTVAAPFASSTLSSGEAPFDRVRFVSHNRPADPGFLEAQDDAQLLELARNAKHGERDREQALETLYARHYPRLLRWCLRFSALDQEAARDLAQEVLLKVHRNLHAFEQRSSFTTWLYTVTRRCSMDRRRTQARRLSSEAVDEEVLEFLALESQVQPGPSMENQIEHKRRLAWLGLAMAEELEPTERQVLHLHFEHGMTLKHITQLLGLQNRTGAKAQLVAAKRKLKRRLEKDNASRRENR